MKQLLTTLLLLFSLTISAQTVDVVGPKKKPKTTAVDANKRKAETDAAAKKRAEEAAAAKRKSEHARQEKLRKNREEQARQEQLRKEQEEQARQDQLRKEQAERERIEQEKRNALRWDDSQKALCFNGMTYKMVYVLGGTFKMGATSEQKSVFGLQKEAKPVHKVTLSSFYIGQTEVTQALWKTVMGNNPSCFFSDKRPVEQVSWNDCLTFINKLNSITGRGFRLPTEAEWEYAARGGMNSYGYLYSGDNGLTNIAWYKNSGITMTQRVASLISNEIGIYDMSGNVFEWCSDWFGYDYYKNSEKNNPTGPSFGTTKVYRGGGWDSFASDCRVSVRQSCPPEKSRRNLGLRLVLAS